MKKLGPRVNVIPIIGRSDTLSPQELSQFKKRIVEEMQVHDIPYFSFPYDEEEDDAEFVEENKELKALLPFAIVGADSETMVAGRR